MEGAGSGGSGRASERGLAMATLAEQIAECERLLEALRSDRKTIDQAIGELERRAVKLGQDWMAAEQARLLARNTEIVFLMKQGPSSVARMKIVAAKLGINWATVRVVWYASYRAPRRLRPKGVQASVASS